MTPNITGSGLTIFDIDDTLFHTTAKIAVLANGKVVRQLSNQEYNTYKLKPGESYDFSQFKDSEKFYHESVPIKRMIEKAKAIIKNSSSTGSRVIIVTARSDFNDKDVFLSTFEKHGIDMSKVYVERAGNISGGSPAQKKATIIRKYLNTKKYSRVRLFDDSHENLKVFLGLQHEFPEIEFEAYFANSDGSIKTVKECKVMKTLTQLRTISEDGSPAGGAPGMSTPNASIPNTTGDTANMAMPPSMVPGPVIRRRYKQFDLETETFRKFEKGRMKFERWSRFLDLKNENHKAIYDYAYKNRAREHLIVIRDSTTGAMRAIRRRPYNGE